MEILMVTAELAPYAVQTDAAETVAALSKTLRQLGHEVTLAVPRYPGFEERGLQLARRLSPLPLPGGGEVVVLDGQLPSGVRAVLFDAPVLFDRPAVYGEGAEDYPDNLERFGLLARATAAFVAQRSQQNQMFDVLHLHDWPAALVPAALKAVDQDIIPSVLTIHDAQRQGVFPFKDTAALGFDKELLADLRAGNKANVLKGGIVASDAVTTVSDGAVEELLQGSGSMVTTLKQLEPPIVGIQSGIDYAIYNPATDPLIVSRYAAEQPANKGLSKSALLNELKLELEMERPVVVAMGTLEAAGGFDLLLSARQALLKNDVTLIVAGSGSLAAEFEELPQHFADQYRFVADPSERMQHWLYAGADFALIPAKRDPAGLPALIAQRYGTLPIVRATGGLKDAVVDCDSDLETGSGFVFEGTTNKALTGAVQRGLAAYRSQVWPRLVHRVMRRDVGWDRPARRYQQVYRQVIGARA